MISVVVVVIVCYDLEWSALSMLIAHKGGNLATQECGATGVF